MRTRKSFGKLYLRFDGVAVGLCGLRTTIVSQPFSGVQMQVTFIFSPPTSTVPPGGKAIGGVGRGSPGPQM
jgi:hypothetical protein